MGFTYWNDAQQAKPITVAKPPTLEKYKKLNIYTAEGKTIKYKNKNILPLLIALCLPKRLVIIHCPGHGKRDDKSSRLRSNNVAD